MRNEGMRRRGKCERDEGEEEEERGKREDKNERARECARKEQQSVREEKQRLKEGQFARIKNKKKNAEAPAAINNLPRCRELFTMIVYFEIHTWAIR